MFKGMKTTLILVAMLTIGFVSCERVGTTEEKEVGNDTTSTVSVSVTESVSVSDVSVTADSAQ